MYMYMYVLVCMFMQWFECNICFLYLKEESALSESVSPSEQVDDITGITEEGIKCRAPFAEVCTGHVSGYDLLLL